MYLYLAQHEAVLLHRYLCGTTRDIQGCFMEINYFLAVALGDKISLYHCFDYPHLVFFLKKLVDSVFDTARHSCLEQILGSEGIDI